MLGSFTWPVNADELATPGGARAVLRRFGIRPSKRWGQHFLVSGRVLRRILTAASIGPDDSILEVGAGMGTLTLGLANLARCVTAVEVDRALLPALQSTAGRLPNVRIVQGDILELAPSALFGGPPGAPRKVVANLPYNIAAAVLTRLLARAPGLTLLVVTVQREVAERIAAHPGTRAYGILSVATQFRARPRILGRIPAGAFLPPPDVESAVLELVPLPAPPVDVPDERVLFQVVAAGFGQRRKTLANALAGGLGVPKEAAVRACGRAGIDPRARAETLDLPAFAALTLALLSDLPTPAPADEKGLGMKLRE